MWKKDTLRKNFLRVKQFADQNLGRAEKSEVLTEDLQSVEKRVEQVKHVAQITTKKIATCLQGTGPDIDKRLKKLPETSLSASMLESATLLGPDTLMGGFFQDCGDCQGTLARELLQYETEVESNVLNPLQAIIDTDIPNINKLKKQLSKLTLDMDSARNRWTTAVRQSAVHGANMASAVAKADQIKDELEDASNRVEQAKDALTTEMFHFVAKEPDHSQKILELMEAQARYHKNAIETIERVLPRMRAQLEQNPNKPMYGMPLLDHLEVTERDIAIPIEACVCTLLDIGMDEEGLFRIAGMASKVKKLKSALDAGIVDMEEFQNDVHAVAGALKLYLRELPEPLLTFALYNEYMQCMSLPQDQKLQALWLIVKKLPTENYNNFRYLIKFLAKLTELSDVNKMTPSNIGIVIGPNLLWSQGETGPNMLTTGTTSAIIELYVTHADYFFPEDVEFRKTCRGSAPTTSLDHIATSPHMKKSQSWQPLSVSKQSEKTLQAALANSMHVVTEVGRTLSESDLNKSPGDNHQSPQSQTSMDAECVFEEEPFGEIQGETITADQQSPYNASISAAPNGRTTTLAPLEFDAEKFVKNSRSRSVPSVPPSKAFHSDVYSTAFALQTLGDGTASDYMIKVRAMWDGQYQYTTVRDASVDARTDGGSGGIVSGGGGGGAGSGGGGGGATTGQTNSAARLVQEVDFGVAASPRTEPEEMTFNNHPHKPPSPAITVTSSQHTITSQSSVMVPTTFPISGNNSPPCAFNQLGHNLSSDSASPKAPRRASKKPAPRPPVPDKASTFPRHASTSSADDGQDHADKWKTMPPARPHGPPPDRPHVPTEKPVLPERPRVPPQEKLPTGLSQPGHQRSLSSGALPAGAPAGPESGDRSPPGQDYNPQYSPVLTSVPQDYKLANANNNVRGNSTATPRLARPTPPPPPPPLNKDSEETHL